MSSIWPYAGRAQSTYFYSTEGLRQVAYVAVNVLNGMVAQNSVRDRLENRTHLLPQVDFWHRKQ